MNHVKENTETILIVDDTPANLVAMVEYLGEVGLRTMVARTGEAGLQIARREQPDLILLDVMLPGMDGFEVCQQLKADEQTRDIPVIFMTVMTNVEEKVTGFQAGGVDYITKPFQLAEVLARVTTHLTLHRLQQELQELNRSLEHQVAARTAELRAANAQLQLELAERQRAEEGLRRLNRKLSALSTCNQALIRAEDEQTLLHDICHIICDVAGYRMAWVGYAEHDAAKTVRPVAWGGVEEGYLAAANITWADTERGRGITGTVIRTGATICIQDLMTDPQAVPWRENALQRGYRSSLAIALNDAHAAPFGALTIYAPEANAFTPDEIRLLEELAADLAFGIVVLHTRAEHKRTEEALRDQYSTLRSIIDSANALIFSVDRQYRYTSFNTGHAVVMCVLYGAEIEIGHNLLDYMTVPEDRETTKRNLDRAFAGEQLVEETYSGEELQSRQYFQVSHSPIKTESGEIIGVTVLAQDITERKQAEEDIRRLNQELEQRVMQRTAQLEAANKELEAFAYSVSHDLRAPLRHIDGFLELLHKRIAESLDAQSQHYMDTISDAAQKMDLLIEDLLSFSRMGRHELSTRPVDLASLVREVIQELEPETEGRNIHWQIADLPEVTGDRAMLHVALVNLVANAVKFTRPRKHAEIEIGYQQGQGEVVVFVRDNGVGFDMQYVDKLFGVFQRLHRAEDFEGTGIGLANVRRIIARHGGRTWAEGQVNQGATFYFALPQKFHGIS